MGRLCINIILKKKTGHDSVLRARLRGSSVPIVYIVYNFVYFALYDRDHPHASSVQNDELMGQGTKS